MAQRSSEIPDAWLSVDPFPREPFPILQGWLDEAFAAGLQPNPHAMALATSDAAGRPSVRQVLCQSLEGAAGSLVFYTHRDGAKGRDLASRPVAAVAFHFGPQNRQARVEGPVTLTSDAESDAYFAGRPLDSQVGAWASAQSEPVEDRGSLEAAMEREARRLGVDLARDLAEGPVPRPPHWGGYRVWAERVELWHSRPGRVHDRAEWRRELLAEGDGFLPGPWSSCRLQP